MISKSWTGIAFAAAVALALALVGCGSSGSTPCDAQVSRREAEPQHAGRATCIEIDGAEPAHAGHVGVARAVLDLDLDQVLVLVLDKFDAAVFGVHPDREPGSVLELEAARHRCGRGARPEACSAACAANEECDDGICKPHKNP